MNPQELCTIWFSPTGASRRIAEAVARGFSEQPAGIARTHEAAAATVAADAATTHAATARHAGETPGTLPVRTVDLTHAAPRPTVIPRHAAAVIAVPVYGGRVAPTARLRLETVRGCSTPPYWRSSTETAPSKALSRSWPKSPRHRDSSPWRPQRS